MEASWAGWAGDGALDSLTGTKVMVDGMNCLAEGP